MLILATKGPKQILFKIVIRRIVPDHDILIILLEYLQLNEIKGFPLILSEFKSRKILPENAIIIGVKKIKRVCKSQVFFSNSPAYFLVHLLLVEQINMLLHKNIALINK